MVWNSVRSTLRAPSNLREAVMEDTIWLINLQGDTSRVSTAKPYLNSNIVFVVRANRVSNPIPAAHVCAVQFMFQLLLV